MYQNQTWVNCTYRNGRSFYYKSGYFAYTCSRIPTVTQLIMTVAATQMHSMVSQDINPVSYSGLTSHTIHQTYIYTNSKTARHDLMYNCIGGTFKVLYHLQSYTGLKMVMNNQQVGGMTVGGGLQNCAICFNADIVQIPPDQTTNIPFSGLPKNLFYQLTAHCPSLHIRIDVTLRKFSVP